MELSLELKSVGAMVKDNLIYPVLDNGLIDEEDLGVPISDCIENEEWLERLSLKDRTELYHYMKK